MVRFFMNRALFMEPKGYLYNDLIINNTTPKRIVLMCIRITDLVTKEI